MAILRHETWLPAFQAMAIKALAIKLAGRSVHSGFACTVTRIASLGRYWVLVVGC